jgi:hypothetical protein
VEAVALAAAGLPTVLLPAGAGPRPPATFGATAPAAALLLELLPEGLLTGLRRTALAALVHVDCMVTTASCLAVLLVLATVLLPAGADAWRPA